jgi:hypothetical protein
MKIRWAVACSRGGGSRVKAGGSGHSNDDNGEGYLRTGAGLLSL